MDRGIDFDVAYFRAKAGDAELAKAELGLSFNQRKLLSLCDGAATTTELVLRFGLLGHQELGKVEKDLARLLGLGLIAPVGGEPARPWRPAPPIVQPAQAAEPLSIPVKPLAIGLMILVAVAAIGWDIIKEEPARKSPPASQLALAQNEPEMLEVPPEPSPLVHTAETPAKAKVPVAGPTKTSDLKSVAKPTAEPERIKEKTQPVVVAKPFAGNLSDDSKTAPPLQAEFTRPLEIVAVGQQPAPAPASVAPPPTAVATLPAPPVTPAPAAVAPALPMAKPAAVITSVEPPAPKQTAIASISRSETTETASAQPKPVYREQPEFPTEAAWARINYGKVKARVTVDERGNVASVDIVKATPARIFNRAAFLALQKWKFEPGTTQRTVDTELVFDNREH